VVLFTGNTDELKKELALKIGIKYYFIKPLSSDFMLETIRTVTCT